MEAEDILVKPLLFSLGFHAFANRTAEGYPTFPSVKCVCFVNPQLFLTLSRGLVSCNVSGVWSMVWLQHALSAFRTLSCTLSFPSCKEEEYSIQT